MGSELFIYGDPRYLSGGGMGRTSIDYTRPPVVKDRHSQSVTTEWLEAKAREEGRSIRDVAHALGSYAGQAVHEGREGYHHRPMLNMFLEEGQSPSAGIELETEERTDIAVSAMLSKLRSNWFHFESDSSLCTGGRQGYELITEPLPPRLYRDPRLWAGLQNLLTPWVESYAFEQTGLHVHVGIDMFEKCEALPFGHRTDRRMLGKYMAAFVYYGLLPRSFIDKVMLRSNTRYCAQTGCEAIEQMRTRICSRDTACGYDLINSMSAELLSRNIHLWRDNLQTLRSDTGIPGARIRYLNEHLGSFGGHGVEVNTAPMYTIEFRRGKGTLHSLSIHRMVELATLVVRYAWRIARNPELPVSTDDVLAFIERSTVNNALRRMALEARSR